MGPSVRPSVALSIESMDPSWAKIWWVGFDKTQNICSSRCFFLFDRHSSCGQPCRGRAGE